MVHRTNRKQSSIIFFRLPNFDPRDIARATLVGKSIQNPAEFRDHSDSGPFELQNFHRNFIFLIVKCVPANSEHVPSGS
jgi:hypothetical protein